MRNSLHPEVLEHVKVPHELRPSHEVRRIFRLFLPLLVGDAQVSVVSEVEARAIVEEFLKVFVLGGQLCIVFNIKA